MGRWLVFYNGRLSIATFGSNEALFEKQLPLAKVGPVSNVPKRE